MFTNSNWFAFQDDRAGDAPVSSSAAKAMEDINLNGTSNGGNSSSDDEVVVGEDEELVDGKTCVNGTASSRTSIFNGFSGENSVKGVDQSEKADASGDMGFFQFESSDNDDLFGDRPIPEWVAWSEASDYQVSGSSVNPFDDQSNFLATVSKAVEPVVSPSSSTSSGDAVSNGTSPSAKSNASSSGSDSSQKTAPVPSLFEEDVEFVGVELEGTEKAMEQALKEGIVGEAGPLKRNIMPKVPEQDNADDDGAGVKEFNDANYWRVDQEVAVLE